MTTQHTTRPPRPKRVGVWGWLMQTTVGNVFRFTGWSLIAIGVSILVEWVGMVKFWGPDHSRKILELEITYLGAYNRNLITGLYPQDVAVTFMTWADKAVSILHLREVSNWFAGDVNSVTQVIAYGLDAMINTIFIFAVRSAICISALSGFVLVGLVAFIDGLVERDIRKACGGIESAMLYHRAKRIVVPTLFLSFGGYLTAPISIHPTLVFLPVMTVFAVAVFVTAKSFKKFL
ncbi:DUF4400 domain-containing protein [Cellvibrio sp. KY-GH-1]|nr:DUF4400 domain-containing protein [Cellvibrio sp. KY-GH-1]